VRQILEGQPLPSYFGGVFDSNYPRTLTTQQILELRKLFRRQSVHVEILKEFSRAIDEMTLSIAVSANRGNLVELNGFLLPSYLSAARRIARTEVIKIVKARIAFIQANDDIMDLAIATKRFPPGPFCVEAPNHGRTTSASTPEPHRVHAYIDLFERLIKGIAEEHKFVMGYLESVLVASTLRPGAADLNGTVDAASNNSSLESLPSSSLDKRSRIMGYVATYLGKHGKCPSKARAAKDLKIPRTTFCRIVDHDEKLIEIFQSSTRG
jgi:hypothetical protein